MYQEEILSDHKKKIKSDIISRKLYLSYPSAVFQDRFELEFDIKNKISIKFDIPFTSVQIVGSAKTGYSYWNDRNFEEKKSDLDIAVIDSRLFTRMLDYAYYLTDGYTDNSSFFDKEHELSFIDQIKYGFINPYFLPKGGLRTEWLNFYRGLSTNYFYLFKNINGGVYASECLFEMKQSIALDKWIRDNR